MIDKTAIIGENVKIGDNVDIQRLTIIEDNCKIGSGSVIKQGCIIGRETIIGESCFIGPGTITLSQRDPWGKFWGGASIRDYVFIGARAVINAGIVINEGSIIGACSFVMNSIKKSCLVVGVPAIEIYQIPKDKNKKARDLYIFEYCKAGNE